MSETRREAPLSASSLDRFLSLFATVQPGEGARALALSLNVFLLLTAYYCIKPVREALILEQGSAAIKSYASSGQVVLLALLVPLYAGLAHRWSRRRLMLSVTLFFQALLLLFYAAALIELPSIGVLFYLFVGVFNVMLVAQFWSFASDIYESEAGERLFAIIAFGASLGAAVGSGLAGQLSNLWGVLSMLPLAALLLGFALLITLRIEKRVREQKAESPRQAEPVGATRPLQLDSADKVKQVQARGSFRLVLRNRYLLLIALAMFLANLVNSTGEYMLGSVVKAEAERLYQSGMIQDVGDWIGSFYGNFFFWVNIVGVLLQAFVVSRIIRWLGIKRAIVILPLIALSSYAILALVPVLSVVRWAKTAENATDYSLNNTVRNALFLPLTREEKYQAKQAVDTFFVRGGDVASAALVYSGLNIFSFSLETFALVNLALVSVWLVVAVRVGVRYAELTPHK